jgi:signal transduction histidine kinase
MAPRWLAGSRAVARRLLPLAMGIVVATFVAATVYSQLLLTSDVDAIDIASNSAPSIAELANARAELRALGRAADRAVTTTVPAVAADARVEYARARRIVDAALAEYNRTPEYRGERELFARVPGQLAALDATVAAGDGTHASDGGAGARREVDAAVDDLDWSLREVSELNRRQLETSAHAISKLGRRKNVYAFLLDGFGILVAFVATVLAMRTVDRLLASQARRTRELEHLAIQVGHEIANPLTPIQVALRIVDTDGGDETQRNAMARARRSVTRIEESIARLTAFARAGNAHVEPAARTALAPALAAVLAPSGTRADVDSGWFVACSDDLLREILGELVAASMPPGAPPLAGVHVEATRHHVRVTLSRSSAAGHTSDPFEPQLHNPGSEHPGIDLRLATVRRRVEACGGGVGARYGNGLQHIFIELPRA